MESRYLAIHPSLETQFLVDNPYAGARRLSNYREYVALYYMEDNQSFNEALQKKSRPFRQGKVTLKVLECYEYHLKC